jgi:hypothetical protein
MADVTGRLRTLEKTRTSLLTKLENIAETMFQKNLDRGGDKPEGKELKAHRALARKAEQHRKKVKLVDQKIAKVHGKPVGYRTGGGRAAAAIDSRRGGVAKSLMTRKLTPKT